MADILLPSGRKIDNSCPYMGDCWGNGGCATTECPDTLWDILKRTAELEHECELIPHTDPDVLHACWRCS